MFSETALMSKLKISVANQVLPRSIPLRLLWRRGSVCPMSDYDSKFTEEFNLWKACALSTGNPQKASNSNRKISAFFACYYSIFLKVNKIILIPGIVTWLFVLLPSAALRSDMFRRKRALLWYDVFGGCSIASISNQESNFVFV